MGWSDMLDLLAWLAPILVIFMALGGWVAWSAGRDCERGMSDE